MLPHLGPFWLDVLHHLGSTWAPFGFSPWVNLGLSSANVLHHMGSTWAPSGLSLGSPWVHHLGLPLANDWPHMCGAAAAAVAAMAILAAVAAATAAAAAAAAAMCF